MSFFYRDYKVSLSFYSESQHRAYKEYFKADFDNSTIVKLITLVPIDHEVDYIFDISATICVVDDHFEKVINYLKINRIEYKIEAANVSCNEENYYTEISTVFKIFSGIILILIFLIIYFTYSICRSQLNFTNFR